MSRRLFIVIFLVFSLLLSSCSSAEFDETTPTPAVEETEQTTAPTVETDEQIQETDEEESSVLTPSSEELANTVIDLEESEKIDAISSMMFGAFPFKLDEPWEMQIKYDFEKTINPDDYFITFGDLQSDDLKEMLMKQRSDLAVRYIEMVLNSSFENEPQAFSALVDEYERTKDEKLFGLVCEYLRFLPVKSNEALHRLRIKYYKQFFKEFWDSGFLDVEEKTLYLTFAGGLLNSMYHYIEPAERIEYMYMIVDLCPYEDITLTILFAHSRNMIDDYEAGRITLKDLHRHLEIMDDNLEKYIVHYSVDLTNAYKVSIYIYATKFNHEAISEKYYEYMRELNGDELAAELKETVEAIAEKD
ncbi:MAG: hypothetical protein HN948_07615 [Clostridia bacterium]|nr:hypothetical protein [Clostridia bacterium]MBT7122862.1 hypothetical protein [Clostridia bacterium]